MSRLDQTYSVALSRLVNESDTAEVLRFMAIHDTVRTALRVALDEGADVALTVTDRVIDTTRVLALDADVDSIQRHAIDTNAVRALIKSYNDER